MAVAALLLLAALGSAAAFAPAAAFTPAAAPPRALAGVWVQVSMRRGACMCGKNMRTSRVTL